MSKDNESKNDDQKQTPGGSMKYYKSAIAGLSLQLNEPDNDDRAQIDVDELKFVPVRFFDEKAGEHYQLGFLATDDEYAQEVFEEDPNVTEIQKSEYDKAMKPSEE